MDKVNWMKTIGLHALFVLCMTLGFKPALAGEFRVAHALSDDSHVGQALARAAERIAKESGGRLVLKAIGNGAAGNDQKLLQDAVHGNLEMFISSTSLIVPVYKPLAILDTPFLFSSREEAHALLDGKIGQNMLSGMSQTDLVGLSFWELGFRNLTNNARPVTRLSDLQGIKLRTMPTELALSTFKRLGADAKSLPFNQLGAALESGAFDGQENPLPTIVSAKLHHVQKYLTLTKHLYGVYGVMASKKWWKTLSEADRLIISNAFTDAKSFQRDESQRATEAALKTIKDAGVKVADLAPGERLLIERRLERVVAPIAQEVGLTLWISVTEELGRIRSGAR
jgi:tripartite ATP-independent transporter DctP family solute receptor